MNPYSYIGNNPLSGTDPTGYLATNDYEEKYKPPEVNTGTHIPGHVPIGPVSGLKSESGGARGQGPKAGCTSGQDCEAPSKLGDLPYNVVDSAQWKKIWKDRTGSVALAPTWGDEVPLGERTITLSTDADSAAFIKHHVKLANQKEDSAVIATAMSVATGLRIGIAVADALLAKTAASTAREMAILREATQGKGNFGLGTADEATAYRVGEAWVGRGARLASDGRTLVSEDGLRQFRPPSWKPSLERVQANFESRLQPEGPWLRNGHLDIK